MIARARAALRVFRRFRGARSGSAAVEFAFVVIPFFLLTAGLAEISMIGFAQTSLDFGVSEAGRQIRTGRAQLEGRTQSEIHEQICTEINRFMVLNCDSNLYLDVTRYDAFVDISTDEPIQEGEFQSDGFGFSPGAPSDIVVVRAYYRWRIMTPMFEPVFQNVSSGERVLVSTMLFRNEPY
jgi:Flp pilus assembly protein TadG